MLKKRQTIKNKEPITQNTAGATLAFRWSFILLPVVILLLSIILAAYFYHLLPVDTAYRFKPDGSPDRWLSRGIIILWALSPQLFLTLLSGATTWGISRLTARFLQPESSWIKPERILFLMGNIMALPQAILCFVMLDIFSYNSYQIHLFPLWVFALIIMGLGGIVLGIFFIQAMRQAWKAHR